MTHELKILHKYFDDLMFEDKNFEIRKNDRDYHVGDKLILKEWKPDQHIYTGNEIDATVNYIHYGNGEYGIAEGYCVMGLTEIECTLGKLVGGQGMSDTVKLVIEISKSAYEEMSEYGTDRVDYDIQQMIQNGKPLSDVLAEIKGEIEQMPVVLLNGFDHIDRTDTLEIIDKHISGEGDKE